MAPLHLLIIAAADGELPEWAEASAERREHVARVAALMDRWGERMDLPADDRARLRAAGLLHDVLRDADHDRLREAVGAEFSGLSGKMLHGPAAAARLREEGIEDEPLLLAVAWHTLGHPGFDTLGKALYLADYLEPGRDYESKKLAKMRKLVPEKLDAVLLWVAKKRVRRSVKKGRPLLEPTVGFWNALVEG